MSYAFLSQPPSAQKLPALSPPTLPARPRAASASTAIAAWAAQIVPGSPAPPAPAPKSPGRPLGSARRSSLSSALRSPASFLHLLDTPSPKDKHAAFGLDFLAQGYTTVIVQLPQLSPLAPRTAPPSESHTVPPPPPTLKSRKSFTRLRSLSFKSAKRMAAAPKPAASSGAHDPPRPAKARSHKSSTPQSRYAHLLAPGGGAGALPLAQEIQLAQMLDGGSLDANVRRVAERHARDTGAVASSSSRARDPAARKDRRPIERREPAAQLGGGVSGVYRDARGGMWWDEDEQLELVELLPESLSPPTSPAPAPAQKKTLGLLPRLKTAAKRPAAREEALLRTDWVDPAAPASPVDALRRGSATSSGSRDSDLDPANAVRPRESMSISGGGGGSGAFVAGYSLAMHRGTQAGYAPGVLDAFAVSPLDASASACDVARPRPRARHRPAPLTLSLSPPTLPVPAVPVPPTAVPSPHHHDERHRRRRAEAAADAVPPPPPPLPAVSVPLASEGRRDFFAASFAPAPAPAPAAPAPASASASASASKENSGTQKSGRRGSVSLGLSAGFSAFANSVSPKSARRASASVASSPLSPRAFVAPTAAVGSSSSNVHLPLRATDKEKEKEKQRTLKHKASRSKLTGLFRSRA